MISTTRFGMVAFLCCDGPSSLTNREECIPVFGIRDCRKGTRRTTERWPLPGNGSNSTVRAADLAGRLPGPLRIVLADGQAGPSAAIKDDADRHAPLGLYTLRAPSALAFLIFEGPHAQPVPHRQPGRGDFPTRHPQRHRRLHQPRLRIRPGHDPRRAVHGLLRALAVGLAPAGLVGGYLAADAARGHDPVRVPAGRELPRQGAAQECSADLTGAARARASSLNAEPAPKSPRVRGDHMSRIVRSGQADTRGPGLYRFPAASHAPCARRPTAASTATLRAQLQEREYAPVAAETASAKRAAGAHALHAPLGSFRSERQRS